MAAIRSVISLFIALLLFFALDARSAEAVQICDVTKLYKMTKEFDPNIAWQLQVEPWEPTLEERKRLADAYQGCMRNTGQPCAKIVIKMQSGNFAVLCGPYKEI